MKKIISNTIFILIFLFHFHLPFLSPFIPKAFAENIPMFASEIFIKRDGSIDVIEKISYDFKSLEKHGIYRTIPYVKLMNNKKYSMMIDVVSVTGDDNVPIKYELSDDSQNIRIKIGDPDALMSGPHNFSINYTVKGAIGYYQTFDELYWNVTGNDWQIPIHNVFNSVKFEPAANIEENPSYSLKCFIGKTGETGRSCDSKTSKNSVIVIESERALLPGEGLTIAFKFPKNLVATLLPKEALSLRDSLSEAWQSRYNSNPVLWSILLLAFGVLLTFWYIIYPIKIFLNWWNNGRDPSASSGQAPSMYNKELTAWFDPPKLNKRFLTPEETGTIIDEWADQKEISAMIIYLAQNGFLYIKEYEKEKFKLVKKASKKTASSYQKYFIDAVFRDSQELDLDTENISDICEKVKKLIFESMTRDSLFVKNPNEIRNFYYIVIALSAFTLNFPLIVSAVIFGLNLVKRTDVGVRLKFEALSLKNFMKSQDRQLEFQAKNQMYFEKLLPYAIAFGIEKVWIKRFEKMNLKNPDWYQSNSTFTNYVFISSLHSSLMTSTMPDTSSGSSSGFSGGGGGGGGGGSW